MDAIVRFYQWLIRHSQKENSFRYTDYKIPISAVSTVLLIAALISSHYNLLPLTVCMVTGSITGAVCGFYLTFYVIQLPIVKTVGAYTHLYADEDYVSHLQAGFYPAVSVACIIQLFTGKPFDWDWVFIIGFIYAVILGSILGLMLLSFKLPKVKDMLLLEEARNCILTFIKDNRDWLSFKGQDSKKIGKQEWYTEEEIELAASILAPHMEHLEMINEKFNFKFEHSSKQLITKKGTAHIWFEDKNTAPDYVIYWKTLVSLVLSKSFTGNQVTIIKSIPYREATHAEYYIYLTA